MTDSHRSPPPGSRIPIGDWMQTPDTVRMAHWALYHQAMELGEKIQAIKAEIRALSAEVEQLKADLLPPDEAGD